MRGVVIWSLLGVLVIYLVIGGIVFWRLESGQQELNQKQTSVPVDEQLIIRLIGALNDVGDNRNCSSGNGSEEGWRDLAKSLKIAIDRFNETTHNATQQKAGKWNIPGSMFFAMTVITTIGYGNLYPSTLGGQAFCCIYAILGIPLCLVVLVNIGDKLRALASRLEAVFTVENRSRLFGRHVRSAIILAIGAIVFLFIPSAVFSSLEGWSYGTAIYFSIVSLATIGFGDYVAGINYEGAHAILYRLLMAVWIFLGLSWLSGFINSVQGSLQTVVKDVNDRPLISRINSQEKRKEDSDDKMTECQLMTGEEEAEETGRRTSSTKESQM